jgi:tRNA(Ile)-lysidine synthase
MEAVRRALHDAADRGLMPRGASILLAVSGGADSTALLYAAAEVAPQVGWTLSVAHVHHGWRGCEADRDLLFVAGHARRLGLPFFSRRCDAREQGRRLGLSREAAARRVRYEALLEMARESSASLVATAHNREDRIETYLLAQRRKGGLASLAGPRERRADGVVRPLLTVPRADLADFLAERGISWRRDATNGDLRLDRNRLRRGMSSGTELEDVAERVEELARARDELERSFEREVLPSIAFGRNVVIASAGLLGEAPAELRRKAVFECARPFARSGKPPLTGREREQIVALLAEGRDFRFEAGRRIRFRRRGTRFEVRLAPGRAQSGHKG